MTDYIIDTSVFVDFFRGKKSFEFETMLRENRVVLPPFVRLELLSGLRKTEELILTRVFQGLKILPSSRDIFFIAESLISTVKNYGLAIGMIDLLIAAQSNAFDLPVFSYDRIFFTLAELKLIIKH